jgi:type II secretory pathway pseudopilin PulG
MRREAPPPGHSLVELLVALSLLVSLGSTAVGLLSAELRLVRRAADAAEAGNAIRFAARLLRAEMQPLTDADSHGLAADSSRQRVFRGRGIVCGVSGTTATVRYAGLRNPDPAKDSIITMTRTGERVQALLGTGRPTATGCTARSGETLSGLELGGAVQPGDVVLVFETGTWHLSGSALRYARGAGGRQPLTPAVFVDDSTRIAADTVGAGTLAIRLEFVAAPAASAIAARLREAHRIAPLNLRAPLDSVVLR